MDKLYVTAKRTLHKQKQKKRLYHILHPNIIPWTHSHTRMQVSWSQNVNRWSSWLSGQTGWVQNIGSHSNATTNCLVLRILLECACACVRSSHTEWVLCLSHPPGAGRGDSMWNHMQVCVSKMWYDLAIRVWTDQWQPTGPDILGHFELWRLVDQFWPISQNSSF